MSDEIVFPGGNRFCLGEFKAIFHAKFAKFLLSRKKTMDNKIVISFSQAEAMQLERIALDRNRDEALEVIEKVILKKIREASRPH